jgi:hypothetical protein
MNAHLSKFQAAWLLAALPAAGQGTLIYDQQSSTTNGAGSSTLNFLVDQPMAQGFTPSLSSIGFVQMEFSDPYLNGLGANVYINVRSDSFTGPVLSATAPVLMPDIVTNEVFTFYFATIVSLTPGTTYYLQPVLQSGDGLCGPVVGQFNYAGGISYQGGFPEPAYDLWFREGVVPEPSTWALLGVGFGLLAARKRK